MRWDRSGSPNMAALLGTTLRFRMCSREKQPPCADNPLYTLPVSAGTGQFLDSEDYELLEATEAVPLSATFAVRLCGDSKTPRFQDGQSCMSISRHWTAVSSAFFF
jgi:hypothetical protein